MSNVPADKIVESIDTFIRTQIPTATEVVFEYKPTSEGTEVKLRSVYDSTGTLPVSGRAGLNVGVIKMEQFLAGSLETLFESPYVINMHLADGEGKFGVALASSDDRKSRTVVTEPIS